MCVRRTLLRDSVGTAPPDFPGLVNLEAYLLNVAHPISGTLPEIPCICKHPLVLLAILPMKTCRQTVDNLLPALIPMRGPGTMAQTVGMPEEKAEWKAARYPGVVYLKNDCMHTRQKQHNGSLSRTHLE